MSARISYTVPTHKPEKKATVRAIRKYKKLIDKVIQIVLAEDSIVYDGYPKSQIAINWGPNGAPDWFCKPLDRYNKAGQTGPLRYNACRVLLALYYAGYTEYYPSLLLKDRQKYIVMITQYETSLDKMNLEEYNVTYDVEEDQ